MDSVYEGDKRGLGHSRQQTRFSSRSPFQRPALLRARLSAATSTELCAPAPGSALKQGAWGKWILWVFLHQKILLFTFSQMTAT